MDVRQLTKRRTVVLGVLTALLTLIGLVAVPIPAHAASYKLTATSCGTTTTDKSCKITVTFSKGSKKVAKATAQLQYWNGKKWVTEKKLSIKKGKGGVSVKHSVMNRKYRVKVTGKKTSKSFTVHFVPATFTIKGSGFGHGVGMAQWGAYRLALDGKKAADILKYYYAGAKLDTANNNLRSIKVQVFGPPADSKLTTSVSLPAGTFTITDAAGGSPVTTAPASTVTLRVSGANATAGFTDSDGKPDTITSPRLRLAWDNKSIATVAGAQGTYRYGNLQATVVGGRLNVVNELKMNTEYLYGIDEMPSSWGKAAGGMEALKAQVIAARTYVVVQAAKWKTSDADYVTANPACDCHVFDDTRSQNFVGAKKSEGIANQPWVAAVDATIHGNLVDVLRAPGGEFAEAPYFSASGEYKVGNKTYRGTGNNQDVFASNTKIPYLQHVADPYSAKAAPATVKSWSRTLTQAEVKKLFGSSVKKLAITARYSSGQVKSIRATLANGKTVTLTRKAAQWQTLLGVKAAWLVSISGR